MEEVPSVLPEHEREFANYFDLVDLGALRDRRVCDLGCGSGRWSYFLRHHCRELILVDFSEAIFVARENLRDAPGALFFMADIMRLPFRRHFADFALCLGVAHHLPVDALEAVRQMANYAPSLLVYVYYALDNRPRYFRALLGAVDAVRRRLARVSGARRRLILTWITALVVYEPLIYLGHVAQAAGLGRFVPLYEVYRGKSLRRIRQDVYDRFFTGIEQRFSRAQILGLRDTFQQVVISEGLPYWHFLCELDGHRSVARGSAAGAAEVAGGRRGT